MVGQTQHKLPFSNHHSSKVSEATPTSSSGPTHNNLAQHRLDKNSPQKRLSQSHIPTSSSPSVRKSSSPSRLSGKPKCSPVNQPTSPAHQSPDSSPYMPASTQNSTHLLPKSASNRLEQVVQHLDSSSQHLSSAPQSSGPAHQHTSSAHSSLFGNDRPISHFQDILNNGKEGRSYGSPVMSLKESIDKSYKTSEPYIEEENIYQIPPTLKKPVHAGNSANQVMLYFILINVKIYI